jgi:hypothetical protein
MISSPPESVLVADRPRRASRVETAIVVAMLIGGIGIGISTLKDYRAGGGVPRFYQENFAPAVMMACGYGFTLPSFATSPPSLRAFVLVEQDTFNCADFPANVVLEKVTWNGTWYYLYGTVALIWKVTGLSWRVLDWLAAVFVGVSLATLYGLFRLVASRVPSVLTALLLTLLPVNLVQMSALRDFSKVPFVLLAVYLLARLVIRPTTTRATVGLSALFGTVVGFGYGFRTDLMIMAPFGFAVIALLLPGPWILRWKRNLAALTAAFAAFLLLASAPLRGLETGGCQFHYSLLGLTDPMTEGLGLHNGLYSFGGHFLDTFVDLKVGDRGARVMGIGVPNLCNPDYDRASGELFFDYARTFPADIITRAYGAVLVVLRSGMRVPELYGPLTKVPILAQALTWINRLPEVMGLIGLAVTFAAVCLAWAGSARLGIALTAFILFLTGYPAIEFESRHWFHLRFIPWWALLLLSSVALRHRRVLWSREHWLRGVVPAAATVGLMALALMTVRLYQQRSVTLLASEYSSARVEPLTTHPTEGGRMDVEWRPENMAADPNHRSTDMLVVTLNSQGCGARGPVDLRIAYQFDNPAHDVSSTVRVRRDTGAPTKVYFPIYAQGFQQETYMKFTHLEVPGGNTDCVSSVERFADRRDIPLWVQMQLPPDWQGGPLHQSLRMPWPLRRFE